MLFCFSLILLITEECDCQDINIGLGYGYAISESPSGKNICANENITIGTEIPLRKNLAFSFCTFLNRLSCNNSDINLIGNVFQSNRFLIISLGVKVYVPVTQKSRAFFELGIYPGWNFYRKEEIYINTLKTTNRRSNLGFIFGGNTCFGVTTQINRLWSFDVGLSGQQDLGNSFKNSVNNIKANRVALYFGLKKNNRR